MLGIVYLFKITNKSVHFNQEKNTNFEVINIGHYTTENKKREQKIEKSDKDQ